MPAWSRHCPASRNPRLGIQVSPTIDLSQGAAWDALVATGSPFLQRSYLRALEGSLAPGEVVRYVTFHEGPRVVGVAVLLRTRFQGHPLEERFRDRPVVSFLGRLLRLTGKPLAHNLLVCGHPTASGEHGFHFEASVDPVRAMESLMQALQRVQAELATTAPVDGVLVKDLGTSAVRHRETLDRHAFARLKVQPAMVLPLDPAWTSLEDYLGCLASKYRVKAKRALTKSAALQVMDLEAQDLIAHRDRFMALYQAVLDEADDRLGGMTFGAFLNLRRTLGRDFILRGYVHEGQLVGFLAGFTHQGVLEAHLVGFDYRLNRDLSIYPRMLLDFLVLGIERRCRQVSYGRTATEIKSTLGAEPLEWTCHLRHRGCLSNRVTRFVVPRLPVEEAPLRMPFTQAWYALRTQQG